MVKKKARTKKRKAAPKKNRKSTKKVKEESVFHLANGGVIDSMMCLANALDQMPMHVFNHHVNDDRNDFSNWIKEVINEPDLADNLQEAKDLAEHHIIVLKYIIKDLKR